MRVKKPALGRFYLQLLHHSEIISNAASSCQELAGMEDARCVKHHANKPAIVATVILFIIALIPIALPATLKSILNRSITRAQPPS